MRMSVDCSVHRRGGRRPVPARRPGMTIAERSTEERPTAGATGLTLEGAAAARRRHRAYHRAGRPDGLRRGMKVGRPTPARRSRCRSARHAGPHHGRARRPIDDAGPIERPKSVAPDPPAAAPKFDELDPSVELLETGIKVIDLVARSPRAARSACSAAPASARPCMMELINNIAKQHGGYRCSPASGERTREGNDFYHEMKVIDGTFSTRWRWCSAR